MVWPGRQAALDLLSRSFGRQRTQLSAVQGPCQGRSGTDAQDKSVPFSAVISDFDGDRDNSELRSVMRWLIS